MRLSCAYNGKPLKLTMNFTARLAATSLTTLSLFFVSNLFAQSIQKDKLRPAKIEKTYSPDSTHTAWADDERFIAAAA